MKIELGRREEIIVCLIIAVSAGLVVGSFFPYSSSYGGELSVYRSNLTVLDGKVLSVQSLREGTSETREYPSPLYVFEWIEFNIYLNGISDGVLEVNFTRDGKTLRTFLISNSASIVVSDFGEYRFQRSNIDISLRSLEGNATIQHAYIVINRGIKGYNPLIFALSYAILATIIAFGIRARRRSRNRSNL